MREETDTQLFLHLSPGIISYEVLQLHWYSQLHVFPNKFAIGASLLMFMAEQFWGLNWDWLEEKQKGVFLVVFSQLCDNTKRGKFMLNLLNTRVTSIFLH